MKKLSTAILACLLILAALLCTSCEKMTTYQVFTNAKEKTEKLDSYACRMTMNMIISSQGVEMTVPMTYDLKMKDLHSEKPIYSGDISIEMFGAKVKMNVYDDGDYMYISAMGEKAKISKENFASEMEDSVSMDISKMGENMIAEFPEEIFKDVTYTEDENGARKFSFALSAEQFETYCKDLGALIAEQAGSSFEDLGVEVKVENINVSVVVNKDGYFESYAVSFDMEMTIDEGDGTKTTMTLKAGMELEIIDPGTPVEVAAPADLDAYVEER